jgi:mRNA-degrading endonuclease YafQ of YafQ-DinJ toxin-antitoxin module
LRFFEIAEPRSLIIERTNRFVKEFDKFSRAYPQIDSILKKFILFKMQHPNSPFNKRDTPFTGGVLSGLAWHFHIIATYCVLIYKVENSNLKLFAVVDHSGYGGSAETSLGKYIKSLSDSDYKVFKIEPESKINLLTSSEQKAISDEFYDWAAKNPEDFKSQSVVDLLDIAVMASEKSEEQILATFGGQSGFMKFVNDISKSLGI